MSNMWLFDGGMGLSGRLSDDDTKPVRFEVPEIERLLADGSPAQVFAAIQALRLQADRYERDLIRSLRWDAQGNVLRTWQQVAELVDAGLASRQAAHQRWGRLKAPGRGQSRRGRPPGGADAVQ